MSKPKAPLLQPELEDFRNFLYLVWVHLDLRAGGVLGPTPVQYDIASYLQHGPRRCVVEAFRGVGKSWMTVAYVLWRLLKDPDLKVLVVSGSKAQADNFSTFCHQLITSMPMLAHLQPRQGQRDSKIQFDVGPAKESKDPSVRSVGITGQITGSRADLIIPDDIESANNSLTQVSRDRLSEAIKEFDAVLKPGGEIKYLGTPQTEMSIYNVLPDRRYEIRVWPARFPDEKGRLHYGDRLAPYIVEKLKADPTVVGSSTDPRRFSDLDLAEREASYGRSGFALQFQLDTTLSDQDRYPLRLSDFVVMDVNPSLAPEQVIWASSPELAWGDDVPNVGFPGDRYYRPMRTVGDYIPYEGTVLAIDPSGRGADELGYAVVSQLNGYTFVLACGGKQGGYGPENLNFLANLALKYKVQTVLIESNFGDGMFMEIFRPVIGRVHPCHLEEVRHSLQKEKRICDTLEPVMNQHRLIVDPQVIRRDYDSVAGLNREQSQQHMLFYQLSRITRDKGSLRHDDRLDALSIAVGHWTQALAQDETKKRAERSRTLIDQELEKYMANVLGTKTKQRSWLTLR